MMLQNGNGTGTQPGSAILTLGYSAALQLGGGFEASGNHLWNPAVAYDYQNRMVYSPSGTAGVSLRYEYSADNKRVIVAKSTDEWVVTLWVNVRRMLEAGVGAGIPVTEYA